LTGSYNCTRRILAQRRST